MIGEYDLDTPSWFPIRSYTWGLDLSGSFQGAGGVGGLLRVKTSSGTNKTFPAYDGNGNIIAWSDLSSGGSGPQEVQKLDYDPFGNIIAREGTVPGGKIPYGFSTKYEDVETGLLYYGYRYYDPVTGRWPRRDPIGERGGINLYGMVRNDSVSNWDYLGLDSMSGIHYYDGIADPKKRANKDLKSGKECGCYGIFGSFLNYETHTGKPSAGDGGIKSNLSIWATDLSASKNCKCTCKSVKILQMVKTTGAAISDFRAPRTAANDWRIDATEHNEQAYVSDSEHGNVHGPRIGLIQDKPGNRRLADGENEMIFTALTCLVCSDKNSKEYGNILGCVGWGYKMEPSTKKRRATGAKKVTAIIPRYYCGSSQLVKNVWAAASAKWDSQYKDGTDKAVQNRVAPSLAKDVPNSE